MRKTVIAATLLSGWAATTSATGSPTCQARSPDRQVQLVELYTSQGCSSCPPADRWLSTLKGRPQVLAAAFHVDYWDRLGWPDRFASPAHTQRQADWVRASAGRFAYTPQVLVDGRDWRGWPTLPLAESPARVSIGLLRSNAGQVTVQVRPVAGAPPRLALWWALLEDGHATAVRAGENRGEQLRQDHVVRRYASLPAWPADAAKPRSLTLDVPDKGEGGHKARLLVVVTDAATGAPLQAAQLDCAAAG